MFTLLMSIGNPHAGKSNEPFWKRKSEQLMRAAIVLLHLAGDAMANTTPDVAAIEEWIDFAEEVQRTEPRFLAKISFPAAYETHVERFLETAKGEIGVEIDSDFASDYQERATRLTSLASSLTRLANFLGADALRPKEIADRMKTRATYLEDRGRRAMIPRRVC